jgi:putative serine protease PepD
MKGRLPAVSVAAVVVTVAAAVGLHGWQAEVSLQHRVAAQEQAISELRNELSASRTDWVTIAATVQQSVATIEAGDFLGSAWVAHTDRRGSDLITNYHVVAEAWTDGDAHVVVRLGDRTLAGTIDRVDSNDDLAIVHVDEQLPALAVLKKRPRVGSAVMAIGSPLGLDGTVTVGIVSAFRSLDGSEYLQFSAPVSPGNSGGPVIDEHGRVVGVTVAKVVYTGAEGLSLAIPVAVVCSNLATCATTESGR